MHRIVYFLFSDLSCCGGWFSSQQSAPSAGSSSSSNSSSSAKAIGCPMWDAGSWPNSQNQWVINLEEYATPLIYRAMCIHNYLCIYIYIYIYIYRSIAPEHIHMKLCQDTLPWPLVWIITSITISISHHVYQVERPCAKKIFCWCYSCSSSFWCCSCHNFCHLRKNSQRGGWNLLTIWS